MSKSRRIFISGTGVPGNWAAGLAYTLFRWVCGCQVISLPSKWGWGQLERSYEEIEQEVETIFRSGIGRLEVAGHSQGAYHAVRLGLEHPDWVKKVIAISGPFGGTSIVPLQMMKLAGAFVPAIADMTPGSHQLLELQEAVAEGWPISVKLRLVAAEGDVFVTPTISAFELYPPAGCDVKKYYAGRHQRSDLARIDEDPERHRFVWSLGIGHISEMIHPTTALIVLGVPRKFWQLAQRPRPEPETDQAA